MNGCQSFVLSGHVAYTPMKDAFQTIPNGYLVCEDGKVGGVFVELPQRYAGLPVYSYPDCLIIPGLCDVHVHAPQYAFRGLGMDLELIHWLNERAFPEECKYADEAYAARAYRQFADDLRMSATTRASVFATVHEPSTMLLMEMLEKSGVCCLVGKVNMDRNAPEELLEPAVAQTLRQTENWLERSLATFERTQPILTPRFVPSCTDELLKGLGELKQKYALPVQSHLSENPEEVEWVRELCPWATCYAHVYERFGLLCGAPTVMAHCVHPTDAEFELLKERDVLVAHCPASNANLTSGIAPVGRYVDAGIRVGLGTDIAGGYDLSVFRAMTDAVQFSKLRSRFTEGRERAITLSEAFYMGTKGGGALFGHVGSFERGYEFDALVLDDSQIKAPQPLSVQERLERAIYLEKNVSIRQKFVQGTEITGGVVQ